MNTRRRVQRISALLAMTCLLAVVSSLPAADEEFSALVKRLEAEKPEFAKRHEKLLAERYDLSDQPAQNVAMARGKRVIDA